MTATEQQLEVTFEAPKNSERKLYRVLLENIHPDPFQPRIHPDAELAASIKAQGLLVPFSVEPAQILDAECPDCGLTFAEIYALEGQFMISDGERRWRGAKAAGLKEVDVEILPPSNEGTRLLRQVTSNTGKPLTPVEEAIAYRSIMAAEGWSQAELGRKLGKPKSLVGDRIRLIELDPVWLEAIGSGRLQVSHAPGLAAFAAVPAEYQAKAAKRLFEDYRYERFGKGAGTLPIDELPRLLRVAFGDYIKPLDRCPGYKGPVIEYKQEYGGKQKFAADIKLWRPCFKKYESKHRKQLQRNAGNGQRERKDVTVDKLEQLPKRKSSEYHITANKGEVVVYVTDSGWPAEFRGIPQTFLELVDPAKLTRVYSQYKSGIVTSDLEAVEQARSAFTKRLQNEVAPKLTEIRSQMRSSKIEEYSVKGPGCKILIANLDDYRNPVPMIAWALGITAQPIDGREIADLLQESEAATLMTGYIAVEAGLFKVPDDDDVVRGVWNKLARTPFKLPPRSPEGQIVESKNALKKRLKKERKQKPAKEAPPVPGEFLEDADYEIVDELEPA